MGEPPVKKLKLELSDPSEPLTRRDVIAFQKEALFRCMNKWKVKANQVSEENEILNKLVENAHSKFAECCAAIVILARNAVTGCSNEEDKLFLTDIINGDESIVSKALTDNSPRLCEIILRTSGNAGFDQIARLKELESMTIKLRSKVMSSEEKLQKATEYYERLIAQYDRQDSETVARVFNRADDDVAKKEKQQSVDSTKDQNDSNGTGSTSNKDDAVAQAQHEMEIAELNTQIEVLEATVKELNSWKTENETELSHLRQKIASTQTSTTDDKLAPHISADSSASSERVLSLTNQNEKLQQINEAYMTKFQQLSSEREIFNNKLTSEFHTAQEALKKHNSSLEKDLVRIRTTRDELLGKVALLEAQKNKSEIMEDLEKILKIQTEQLEKFETRDSSNQSQDALMKELQDLEKGFKELSQTSNKKYMDYMNQESIITKLNVEKTKASEKYFAAMRSKDAIMIENKNLTKNLSKSNELITQLKDLEKNLQMKIENLYKQLSLSQDNEKRLQESNKESSVKILELTSKNNKLVKTSEHFEQENKGLIAKKTELEYKMKDKEIENKQLRIKLTNAENKAKKLYKTLLSNGGDNGALTEELENFRTIIYCSLCSKNWKNTTIKTCGHVFCDSCCKERLAARMRKCPTCNKPFSSNDILTIHL